MSLRFIIFLLFLKYTVPIYEADNLLYPLFNIFLFLACSTQKLRVAYSSSFKNSTYPSELEKVRSFYLIGGGGNLTAPPSSALNALESLLDSASSEEDFVIFLGDNTRAEGLVHENEQKQQDVGNTLDYQIGSVKGSSVRPIFIPGELDWDDQGMAGLERQKEYLEEKLDEADVLMPGLGCPLQFVDNRV